MFNRLKITYMFDLFFVLNNCLHFILSLSSSKKIYFSNSCLIVHYECTVNLFEQSTVVEDLSSFLLFALKICHFPFSGFWRAIDSMIIANDVVTDLSPKFFGKLEMNLFSLPFVCTYKFMLHRYIHTVGDRIAHICIVLYQLQSLFSERLIGSSWQCCKG